MEEINYSFWKNRSVLVTGAAGFLGSQLCAKLADLGSNVRALIRYNSANSYGLLDLLPVETQEKIEIYAGDILDEASLLDPMKDVDVVFHLAAIPSIPYSLQNPRHVFQVNVQGTTNVLFAAKAASARKVVLASSAGASDKRHPLSPYITSKAAMEKVGLGFVHGFHRDVTTIRLLNNYGPGQSARAIVPTIISQALERDDVHLGALDPKLDFTYSGDTIAAFLRTAESGETPGNILTWGTGSSISVKELAEQIFKLVGRKGLHIVTDEKRVRKAPGPVASLEDDIKNTHRILQLSPHTDLQTGLQRTIAWIFGNKALYKTGIYNI